MARSWQQLKQEIEEETRRIFLTCPDEIKRFHYGIITHSDAGKYSYDQYFGHWVHAYCAYSQHVSSVGYIISLAMDPDFNLAQIKKMFETIIGTGAFFAEYGGAKLLAKYSAAMIEAWDTLETREEAIELLNAFQEFVSRLYWWFHWYFPWGVGPGLFPRLLPEDIKEIVRLSQTS